MLNGWIAAGGRAIIATQGGDYNRFAQVFGGEVTTVRPADPDLALSPFPPVASVQEGPDADEHVDQLTSILALMAKEPGETPTLVERSVITLAIRRLYASLATDAAAPTLQDWVQCLADLRATLPTFQEQEAADSIGALVRFWLSSPYGAAFNRSRSPITSPVAVWNLEHIKDRHTLSLVLALFSSLATASLAHGKLQLVMDEVWATFKVPAGAALLEVAFRTWRKRGGSITIISQGISDYLGLPEVLQNAILNNAQCKYILPHEETEIPKVAEAFLLNDREQELLAGLRAEPGKFTEFLGMFGPRRQVLRLAPTPLEYWLATSHHADLKWEALVRQANPDRSLLEILKGMARKWPGGAMQMDVATQKEVV